MSDEMIVKHCAPTLAGIKTGNMFLMKHTGEGNVTKEIRELNYILVKKGLRVLPLRITAEHVLVYIYRPDYLEKDLSDPLARKILIEKGYESVNANRCIRQLIAHFRDDKEFPHEVGLFLGYPPKDVSGFMNSPHDGVKCCGCWKSYSEPEKAEITFRNYKRCTEVFQMLNRQGKTLEQLAVVCA
ncbi:MAG: DUF3793 family protein [Lachnospiraceae bacterium]|nr:DUF3793 family protein [Lachnospiraceae bacterium]